MPKSIAFLVLLAACATSTKSSSHTPSEPREVVAAARVCADRLGGIGVLKSPLRYEAPVVQPYRVDGRPESTGRWLVQFPEQQVGVPSGRAIVVEADGSCVSLPLD